MGNCIPVSTKDKIEIYFEPNVEEIEGSSCHSIDLDNPKAASFSVASNR